MTHPRPKKRKRAGADEDTPPRAPARRRRATVGRNAQSPLSPYRSRPSRAGVFRVNRSPAAAVQSPVRANLQHAPAFSGADSVLADEGLFGRMEALRRWLAEERPQMQLPMAGDENHGRLEGEAPVLRDDADNDEEGLEFQELLDLIFGPWLFDPHRRPPDGGDDLDGPPPPGLMT